MSRKRRVGTGITRHLRINFSWDEHERFKRETADVIFPHENFLGWLEQREAQIAEILEHFKLPAPNRHVVWDKENPRNWRYEDDPLAPGQHFAPGGRSHTEWHLQAFEYQSRFWYFGRILLLIGECKSSSRNRRWLELAGRAMELGVLNREFQLKFSGERRLRDFEEHARGADDGNAIKKQLAANWQAQVRKIITTHPDIDLSNNSAAARDVLAAWPPNHPTRSHSTLRRYVAEVVAERGVLPEPPKTD